MRKGKKIEMKVLVLVLLTFFVASAFTHIETYASTEDELLAEFIEDPANLLPEMFLLANGSLSVRQQTVINGMTVCTVKEYSTWAVLSAPVILSTDENLDKVAVGPRDEAENDKDNFGIKDLVGDKTYLLKNTTTGSYTTLSITNDFSVENYNYLLFDNLMSKDGTTALSLKISFGKTSTANISDSAQTYNKTIINSEVLPIVHDIWYNLALETNETFPYVINIEIKNAKMDGFYIFALESSRNLFDARYTVTYLDADETIIQSAESIFHESFISFVAPHSHSWIIQEEKLEDLDVSKMLSVNAPIDQQANTHVKAVGWEEYSDLESDLKEAWRQQLIAEGVIDEDDEVVDYSLDRAYWQSVLNLGLIKLLKKALREELAKTNDYPTLVIEALKKVLPLSGISNEDDPLVIIGQDSSIQGFWNTIGKGFQSLGSGIASVAKKAIDLPVRTINALGNAAGNILRPVGHTVASVASSATNMIKDATGHVVHGVVGVAGAAANVGKNLLQTLKLPLIILSGVAGVAGVTFLVVRFGKRR